MAYCPGCGVAIDGDEQYCPQCGEHLGGTASATAPSQATADRKRPHLPTQWVVGILLPVIAVAALFGGVMVALIVFLAAGTEDIPNWVGELLGVVTLLLTALAVIVAPYSYHRERKLLNRATGWEPTKLYYLLCVPVLNIAVSLIYMYQRGTVLSVKSQSAEDREQTPHEQPTAGKRGESHVPAALQYERVLKYAVPLGGLAWAIGTGVMYLIFDSQVVGGVTITESMFLYGFLHGIVEVSGSGGSEMLIHDEPAAAAIFAALPALWLVLFGAMTVSRSGGVPDSRTRGAIAGGTVAAGYVVPLVLVALFVNLEVATFSVLSSASVSLDPITAALGGVLYAVVFGGIGGLTTRIMYGRYLRIGLLTVCALLTLILLAVP